MSNVLFFNDDPTFNEVFYSLTSEERNVVYFLIGTILKDGVLTQEQKDRMDEVLASMTPIQRKAVDIFVYCAERSKNE